jgi:lipopolysaccharide biosynthesis regulator YciM
MPASTFHEWVSARAYARVRALRVAGSVVSMPYANAATPTSTAVTAPAASESQVESRFAKGMALAAANDTAAAIEVFAHLTQEYPRLLEPHVQLAALYVKQGEHRKALATLRTALALRADEARVQAALGDLYVTLGARAYRAATAAGAPEEVQQKYGTLEQLERRTRAAAADPP